MIARISGVLVYKSVQAITLEAYGIGYRVFVPLTTFYELPETGQPITLHIHTHVKEDAINLFGFHSLAERNMFQVMISVSGIGPRLAMNILSGISVEDLVDAITGGNLRRLLNIPGVGRKMAERLVLELKDKVLKLERGQVPPRDRAVAPRSLEEEVKEDALSALINLGYKSSTAREVIEKIMKDKTEIPALDLLLKQALQQLSG